jgi:hypothetical protein
LWEKLVDLRCEDQKLTWKLQATLIQATIPPYDSPLLEMLKCSPLAKFLKWYTQIRKKESKNFAKAFEELDQISERLRELSKSILNRTILMSDLEVIFMNGGVGNNHNNSNNNNAINKSTSIDTSKKMLEYFVVCEIILDVPRFKALSDELAQLHSDLASIPLLYLFSYFL